MNNEKFFILGIDAGFRNTGLSFLKFNKGKIKVVSGTVICTELDKSLESVTEQIINSSNKLYYGIKTFIESIHNPYYDIAIEYPTGGSRSAAANRAMGSAISIISIVLQENNLHYNIISPKEVKDIVCGEIKYKKIPKQFIISYVNKKGIAFEDIKENISKDNPLFSLAKLKSKFEHFADATAAAIVLNNKIKDKRK